MPGTEAAGGSWLAGAEAENKTLLVQSFRDEYLERFRSACDPSGGLVHCVKRVDVCAHWDSEEGVCLKWDTGNGPSDEPPGADDVCGVEQMVAGTCPRSTEVCFIHEEDGLTGMPYLLVALLLGCIVTAVLAKLASARFFGRKVSLPFTVVMFLLGFFMDVFAATDFIKQSFPTLSVSVGAWLDTHPHIILFVLLPPLLFEDSVSIDYHTFRKSLASSLLLAGPGVLLSTTLTGMFSSALFYHATSCSSDVSPEKAEYCEGLGMGAGEMCEGFEGCYTNRFHLSTHLLLGGILAATDPVAVVAALKALGAPEKLNMIIGGESLLNDGTAVVVFFVMRDIVAQCHSEFLNVAGRFLIVAGGGVIWGALAGYLTFVWLRYTRKAVVEISIMITTVLMVFWVAENVLHVSGVLASVVFGLTTARKSYFAMNADTLEKNHVVWEQMGFLTTMILFMMAGIIVRGKISKVEMSADDMQMMMLKSFVLYVGVFVIRGFVIACFFPLLKKVGYSINVKEAVIMTFGGLRGAVSLALALLVDSHPTIPNRIKDFVLMQTAAVVTLSLLINGTTIGMVYHKLELYRVNVFSEMLVRQTMQNQHDRLQKVLHGHFVNDWFHKHANLEIVERLMPIFKDARMEDDELVGVEQSNVTEADWSIENLHSASHLQRKHANQAKMGADAGGGSGAGGGGAGDDALQPGSAASTPLKDAQSTSTDQKKATAEELMDGTSDPYVEVLIMRASNGPSKRKSTPVEKKTLNPRWAKHNKFKFSVSAIEPTVVYCHVFDWDIGLTDDYLGEAKLDVTELIARAHAGGVPSREEQTASIDLAQPTKMESDELFVAARETVQRKATGWAAGESGRRRQRVLKCFPCCLSSMLRS
eukprot:SAG22_NODE_925_length_6469_cov_3.836264_5_plen_872_part_00